MACDHFSLLIIPLIIIMTATVRNLELLHSKQVFSPSKILTPLVNGVFPLPLQVVRSLFNAYPGKIIIMIMLENMGLFYCFSIIK